MLESIECGCGSGIRANHYFGVLLDIGRYCIQGKEGTSICGANLCVQFREM